MTMHPSGRHIPDATGCDETGYYETAYSETTTRCDCGTRCWLPEYNTDEAGVASVQCSCGTISCWDCWDVGGCTNPSCDRMADRYDDDYYRWEER